MPRLDCVELIVVYVRYNYEFCIRRDVRDEHLRVDTEVSLVIRAESIRRP
jgi:hypothetical protein